MSHIEATGFKWVSNITILMVSSYLVMKIEGRLNEILKDLKELNRIKRLLDK